MGESVRFWIEVALCHVKPNGENEWGFLFIFIAVIYMSENQNVYIIAIGSMVNYFFECIDKL